MYYHLWCRFQIYVYFACCKWLSDVSIFFSFSQDHYLYACITIGKIHVQCLLQIKNNTHARTRTHTHTHNNSDISIRYMVMRIVHSHQLSSISLGRGVRCSLVLEYIWPWCNQCFTTGVTKAVVCVILSVGWCILKNLAANWRFLLSLSEWSFTICPMPYNHMKICWVHH